MAVLQPPPVGGFPAMQAAFHPADTMLSMSLGSGRSFEYWHHRGIWWWDPNNQDAVMDHPNSAPGWTLVGPPFDPQDWWIVVEIMIALERRAKHLVEAAQGWFNRLIPGGGDGSVDDPDPGGPTFPSPGGPPMMPGEHTQLASGFPAVAGLFIVIRGIIPNLARGVRIPWGSLPGWLRTILIALGFAEGVDIIWDLASGGTPDLPFIGGGSADPTTQMVEAMTVSTWEANGVTFHRLSDGRLATRNKNGVWKIWRPKKPIVIFATGVANLPDLLRADRAIDKQAKKIAKTLRNRGYQVRKKTEAS